MWLKSETIQSSYVSIKENDYSIGAWRHIEPLSVSSEERQQTSLTEWCDARQDVLQPEPAREKTPTCVLQENNLLDDGGDSVFSQMVSSFASFTWWHNDTPSSGVFFKLLFSPCAQSEKDVATLEPWLLREMDACISNIFLHQDSDAFIQLFNLILNENISGNQVMCALKRSVSWSLLCFSHVIVCSFSGLWTQRDERHGSDGGRRSRVHQPDGAAPEHGRKRQHQSLQRLVRRAPTGSLSLTKTIKNSFLTWNKINVNWNLI